MGPKPKRATRPRTHDRRLGPLAAAALVLLAPATGCRDFSLPDPGAGRELAVTPGALDLAPGETERLDVEGGTPPYTLADAGASGDYVRFALTDQSGGWAYLDGERTVAYTAGDRDQGGASAATVEDVVTLEDARGARVEVPVRVGPPLRLHLAADAVEAADGVSRIRVPAGGSAFFGATGGRGPYLFGLSAAPSGGGVDAVTGRYRAGAVGCVTDGLVVVDDTGAQAAGQVVVECPPLPGSPEEVLATVVTDLGHDGIEDLVHVVRLGRSDGALVLTGAGGARTAVPLGGAPLSVAAVRSEGHVVVAVQPPTPAPTQADPNPAPPPARILDVHVEPSLGLVQTDLLGGQPWADQPAPGSTPRLVSGDAFAGLPSPALLASWRTGDGRLLGGIFDVASAAAGPVVAPLPAGLDESSPLVPVAWNPYRESPRLGFVALAPRPLQTEVYAVDPLDQTPLASVGRGGPLALSEIRAVAGAAAPLIADAGAATPALPRIGLLGVPAGQGPEARVLVVAAVDPLNGTFDIEGRVALPDGTDLLGAGPFDGWEGDEFTAVEPNGRVHLVLSPGDGWADRPTPWYVGGAPRRLLATDLDGDGGAELLLTDDPAGGPAVFIDPSSLPASAGPVRGLFGQAHLTALLPGAQPARVGRRALLAVDLGRDAAGDPAEPSDAGGGLVAFPAGMQLGEGEPVDLGVSDAAEPVRVVAAATAQLEGPEDPADVVAVVRGTTSGRLGLRVRTSSHEGMPDPAYDLAVPGVELSEVRWLRTLRDETGSAEAVVVGFVGSGAEQVLAVRAWGGEVGVSGPVVLAGSLKGSAPGWLGTRPGDADLALPLLVDDGGSTRLLEATYEGGELILAEVASGLPAELHGPALELRTPLPKLPFLLVAPKGEGVELVAQDDHWVDVGFPVDHLAVMGMDREMGLLQLVAASDDGASMHLCLSFAARKGELRPGAWLIDAQDLGPLGGQLVSGLLVGDDDLPDLVSGAWPSMVRPGLPASMQSPTASMW